MRAEAAVLTSVEKCVLKQSPFEALYAPDEKIPTIVVDSFPMLGRLAAMRFVEWVQSNPEGVVSLPTGKTPEHFISWVQRLLRTWGDAGTRTLLGESGVDPSRRPDMHGLRFVQIDEFYPIDPTQTNSFYHYVNKYYIEGFGLDRRNCMLIDCTKIGMRPGEPLASVWPAETVDLSLRVRQPTTALETVQRDALLRVDQWCLEYEDRIRSLGGIGFFLGGIGPDGHIGFNVRGSDHHSTTRLTATNYETQAAAATDLGGVAVARNRLVITIGLGTIAFNPACAALVIAAGEAKAGVVADAIQSEKSIAVPACALHGMANARFYITRGAAKLLRRRQQQALVSAKHIPDEAVARALVDCSMRLRKRLVDLTDADVRGDVMGAAVLGGRAEPLATLAAGVHQRLAAAVEAGAGVRENARFLHTEPHHDDIMLGYLPAAVRHIRVHSNDHVFATLTSGFTAVTNEFMLGKLTRALDFIDGPTFRRLSEEGYFAPSNRQARNRDVWRYLDGVTERDRDERDEGASRRLIRDLVEVFEETNLGDLRNRIEELTHYFRSEYPGKKDLGHIQRLKGMCREWEAECLWGYFGWNTERVRHLRLGFYTGDIFTEEPTFARDVAPIVSLLTEVNPDVVSVALDPEGSGPDTHYKVLQAIAEALRMHGRADIRVWGYRNVWYHYHPSEANMFVPVSLNMFAVMEAAFMNTFVSQKDAPFPSYEYDGPFCGLAQRIQSSQYQAVKTCLGRDWFYQHPSALIRATRGLVFLKEMSLDDLYAHTRELRRATENA